MHISSPLLNLALLESLKAKSYSDEIDLFIPFIAVTIAELGKATFTAEDVQEKLASLFGFKPPIAAIKALLSRCKKRGLVQIRNHTYIPNMAVVETYKDGFSDKRKEISVSLGRLNKAFISYSKEKFDKDIDEAEAELLVTRIIEKNTVNIFDKKRFDLDQIEEKIKNIDYFTASFIAHLHRNEKELFEDFNRIVKGLLLANYLCFADKTAHKKTYGNITVYLDTPLVIGLLGFSGKQRKKVLEEFLDLIKSLHIKIYIFEETFVESERLLSAWKHDLEQRNYKRFNPKTLELLRIEGYDHIRLDTEIRLLRKNIESLKISIKYGFKANPRYQCDEHGFETVLKKFFSDEKDLNHDISCISHIHNLREEKKVADLGSTFSIFVSPSFQLVKASYQYFFDEIRSSIPLAVTEQWMTTLFWLKNPGLHGSLPLDQMISTAYGLLHTDDKFWQSFISRLEKIEKRGDISHDDFVLVRWDTALLNQVHDASVDVGEDFTDSDIFEIVERIKAKQIAEKDAAIAEISQQAEKAVVIAATERDGAISELNGIKGNIDDICMKIASGISWCAAIILIISVFLVTYASIPHETFPSISSPGLLKASIFGVALIINLLFATFAAFFGISIKSTHETIKHWIYSSLSSVFLTNQSENLKKKEPRID